MDNDIYNSSLRIRDHLPILVDAATSHSFPAPHLQPEQLDLNTQAHLMTLYPFCSAFTTDRMDNQQTEKILVNNNNGNSAYQDEFGGTSLSVNSLPTLLSASTGLHVTGVDTSISASSQSPLDFLNYFVSNHHSHTPNLDKDLVAGKKDLGVDSLYRWDYGKISAHPELPRKAPATVAPSYHVTTNQSYGYNAPMNDLSLSLATCQNSIIVPYQCTAVCSSNLTQEKSIQSTDPGEFHVRRQAIWPMFHDAETGVNMGFQQNFTSGEDAVMSRGSGTHLSSMVFGSKYLRGAQEILVEVASYTLKNLNQVEDDEFQKGTSLEFPFSSGQIRWESEAKKAELLAMLQVVERRYSQCLDHIQAVIAAFPAVTDLDPQIHAQFAIQTVSDVYRNLKARISSQILISRNRLDGQSERVKDKLVDSSFVQKHWALQQLKRNDIQAWRPQRGLPEKSVSVLRAWMFQNFLHPYPKDGEKQLLSIQSGLTRNQVSNWFINARVRLWKPMIEEMYSEINNKKARNEGHNSK